MTNTLTSTHSLFALAGVLLLAIYNSWTARLNQFFFFSRTVWAGFAATDAARQIVLNYKVRIWLAVAPALLVYAGILSLTHLPVVTSFFGGILVQTALNSWAFALAHGAAGEALLQNPGVESAADARTAPDAVSIALQPAHMLSPGGVVALLLAPLAAAAVWVGTMLCQHLSATQLMAALEANKADFLNGLGLGMLFAALLFYVLIRYFSRNRTALGRFTANGALLLAWIGAAALIGSTLTVPFHWVVTRRVRTTVMIAILGVVVLRMLYTWSRARLFPPAQIERNGDVFWRWGLFYCNPSDPTLFIQHRSCPGYTVNFANFISWPLTLLFVADMVFLVVSSAHR